MTTELPDTQPSMPATVPLALKSNEGLGVVAQPLPFWMPVVAALPALDVPVWLYAPDRGIWVGARSDLGDGWMWGNTYGSHYYAETSGGVGAWRCRDNEVDEDYCPAMWMPLPLAPTPNVRAEPTPEAQRVSPTCDDVQVGARRAYVLCRRRSARARG